MRFQKTIKRMIALGTGAIMLGSSVFAAADLATYPAPFVKDGKFSGMPGGRARFSVIEPPDRRPAEGRFYLATRRGKQFTYMLLEERVPPARRRSRVAQPDSRGLPCHPDQRPVRHYGPAGRGATGDQSQRRRRQVHHRRQPGGDDGLGRKAGHAGGRRPAQAYPASGLQLGQQGGSYQRLALRKRGF